MNQTGTQPEGAVQELAGCQRCGAAIRRPGVCEVCAAAVSKVDQVVGVSPRAWIEPEDLRDE